MDVAETEAFWSDLGRPDDDLYRSSIDHEQLRAPFPWFGGKRRVAQLVWSRLGDVRSYNEPFAGGLSVLLGRPTTPRIETVNDLDCFIANVWRAIQNDPVGVAFWCDGPVNEADLHSRHRWLVSRGRKLVEKCRVDPHYFNAKVAGWWLYGQCLWIGSGWCEAMRPPSKLERPETFTSVHKGVHRQRNAGDNRNENPSEQAKRPKMPERGYSGVHRGFDKNGNNVDRRWQGGGQGGGSGVHAPRLAQQAPDLTGDYGASGRGIHAPRLQGGLYDYMNELCARLRRVRVCCGDWRRVLTPSVTTYIGLTGVFLDPPYGHELRERCYAEDHDIAQDVGEWAREHGDDPNFRIALCGYVGEHEMPATWECVPWKAHGGYSRSERGIANRSKERIWFSPHCLRPSDKLF